MESPSYISLVAVSRAFVTDRLFLSDAAGREIGDHLWVSLATQLADRPRTHLAPKTKRRVTSGHDFA